MPGRRLGAADRVLHRPHGLGDRVREDLGVALGTEDVVLDADPTDVLEPPQRGEIQGPVFDERARDGGAGANVVVLLCALGVTMPPGALATR